MSKPTSIEAWAPRGPWDLCVDFIKHVTSVTHIFKKKLFRRNPLFYSVYFFTIWEWILDTQKRSPCTCVRLPGDISLWVFLQMFKPCTQAKRKYFLVSFFSWERMNKIRKMFYLFARGIERSCPRELQHSLSYPPPCRPSAGLALTNVCNPGGESFMAPGSSEPGVVQ